MPDRLLEEVPELSAGDGDAGNLLIQGDNLEALKALLPFYAGRVKCNTARKMVKALKFGTVPEAQDIRSRQKALLADFAQPRENDTDPGKVRLAQEIYRCFTLDETSQICEGRSPFLETLASDADRSRVAARFKALHDFEIAEPAPWAILHRTVAETLAERNAPGERLAERNAPGERLAGRSDPAEASRFPTREV